MKLASFLSLIFTLIVAGACSTTQVAQCHEPDWYELGRQTGALGHPMKLNSDSQLICKDSNPEINSQLYTNGHRAGLIDYCKPTNAFELGRSGINYDNICPIEYESKFLVSYYNGIKIRRLKEANHQLDLKLNKLAERFGNSPVNMSKSPEVSSLQNEQEANLKEISRIESTIN